MFWYPTVLRGLSGNWFLQLYEDHSYSVVDCLSHCNQLWIYLLVKQKLEVVESRLLMVAISAVSYFVCCSALLLFFLSSHSRFTHFITWSAACGMIRCCHDAVIGLSETLCIVAKHYNLQQKCLNNWIGNAPLGTCFYNFQPLIHRAYPHVWNFSSLLIFYSSNDSDMIKQCCYCSENPTSHHLIMWSLL